MKSRSKAKRKDKKDEINYDNVASLYCYVKFMSKVLLAWKDLTKKNKRHDGFKLLQNSINEVRI